MLGWCLPKDYQKLESPRPDSPVNVDINVEILDILSVNDKEFSISMSMYFSVMWQESRIVTKNEIEPGFWYPVSLEFLDYLWTPNIFIYNLKSFNSAKVLNRLAGEERLRIYNNGEKLINTFRCLDHQWKRRFLQSVCPSNVPLSHEV